MLKKSSLFSDPVLVQVTSAEEYFAQLSKNIVSGKAKKYSEMAIEQSETDVFQMIQNKKIPVNSEPAHIDANFTIDPDAGKPIEQLLKDRKYREMDKLRREIAVSILDLETRLNNVQIEDTLEQKKLLDQKKLLIQKVKSIEQDMNFMKYDQILENNEPQFLTRKVAYRKQNENQSLHKNISHIQDPEHFREQEDFIRKIICEREELKKKRMARVKAQEAMIKAEELKIQVERNNAIQETNMEKRVKIQEFIRVLEERQQIRQQNKETQNQMVKDLLKKGKQLERTNKKKLNLLENPNLEEKKETLKAIRDLHVPLRKDVLDQREDKYKILLQENETKRNQKLEERNKVTYAASYMSENYKNAQNETLHMKRYKKEEMKSILDKVQSRKHFSEQVREDFVPEIDPAKESQIEALKSKINHSVDFKSYISLAKKFKQHGVFFSKETGGVKPVQLSDDHYDKLYEANDVEETIKEKGIRYLNAGGRMNKKNRSTSSKSPMTKVQSTVQSVITSESAVTLLKQVDYLSEQRKKHPIKKPGPHDFEKIANKEGIPELERDRMLYNEAQALEREARRMEQLLRARRNRDATMVDDIDTVDDLIFSSIKAKLLVLNRPKQN